MREIKFRAWEIDWKDSVTKEQGRMIDLSKALETDAYGIIMVKEILDGKHSSKYIPMQFTGLKDKNGVEIYEGDIVKDQTTGAIAEVCFKHAAFWVNKRNLPDGQPLILTCTPDPVEILGNIYQNPELLK